MPTKFGWRLVEYCGKKYASYKSIDGVWSDECGIVFPISQFPKYDQWGMFNHYEESIHCYVDRLSITIPELDTRE